MDRPTRLPMMNQAQLSLRDYSLLSDLTKVLTESAASLAVDDLLVLFERLNVSVEAEAVAGLFTQADGTGEGRLPAAVLAQAYCYEVQSLSNQSVQLISSIQSFRSQKESLQKQLKSTSAPCDETGTLTVRIGRLVGLSPVRTCSFAVICEQQRRVTRKLQSNFPDGWDQQLDFRVMSGAGDVLFSLVSEADVLGQCAVPLPSLRDQQRHEAWVDLSLSPVKVHLSLQWVHSPRLSIERQIANIEAEIDKKLSDLEATEKRLKALGMRVEEDWSTAWMRKAQFTAQYLRQSSCSGKCQVH